MRLLPALLLCGATLVAGGPFTKFASAQTPPRPAEPAKPRVSDAELRETGLRVVLREFDEWASVQKTYEPDQVKEFRAQIVQKAQSLEGTELGEFLVNTDQRLQILTGAEAREARKWLNEELLKSSPQRKAQIKSELPDVAHMSIAQLEEAYDNWQSKRAGEKRETAAFIKSRDKQVQDAIEARQREVEANARAKASSGGGYSPYGGNNRPFGGAGVGRYGRSGIAWGGYRW